MSIKAVFKERPFKHTSATFSQSSSFLSQTSQVRSTIQTSNEDAPLLEHRLRPTSMYKKVSDQHDAIVRVTRSLRETVTGIACGMLTTG
jgi:hypothetical protein